MVNFNFHIHTAVCVSIFLSFLGKQLFFFVMFRKLSCIVNDHKYINLCSKEYEMLYAYCVHSTQVDQLWPFFTVFFILPIFSIGKGQQIMGRCICGDNEMRKLIFKNCNLVYMASGSIPMLILNVLLLYTFSEIYFSHQCKLYIFICLTFGIMQLNLHMIV